MPDFTVRGNPAAVRQRAGVARTKGQSFVDVATNLSKVTTDGWTGRAADRFREAFDAEPQRWQSAGNGFISAANALDGYAAVLEDVQRRALEAKAEYERGDAVSAAERSAYDADVSRARNEAAQRTAAGQYTVAVIHPFVDPGEQVRQTALGWLSSARADLDAAAHSCAQGVRGGCAGAPDERNWLESGLAFVGGVLLGAGEALWDLGKLVTTPIWKPITDLVDLATGHLTPEELAMTHRLTLEQVGAMGEAMWNDPVGFGKELGKGLLDWDTWADDPARAIGHLLPDAVAAVLTAGTGAAATRGASGLSALLRHGDDLLDGAGDAASGLNRADGLTDLNRLDHLDDLAGEDLARGYRLDDGSDFATSAAPEQLDTGNAARNVIENTLGDADLYERHGVDGPWFRQELIDRINTPTDELSAGERGLLNELRDSVGEPQPGEWMQKVLTPDAAGTYLENVRTETRGPDTLGGSVTRAGDTAHLGTPKQLHDGLRLDYQGTPFTPSDQSSYLVRFRTEDPSFEVPRNSTMGGSGSYDDWSDPFTGNGFTKATGDLVPEWQTSAGSSMRMREGAEMWEVLDTGTQRLTAVLLDGEWVRVGRP